MTDILYHMTNEEAYNLWDDIDDLSAISELLNYIAQRNNEMHFERNPYKKQIMLLEALLALDVYLVKRHEVSDLQLRYDLIRLLDSSYEGLRNAETKEI